MSDARPPDTILFADVAGSTGIYERLGDAAAHARIEEALSGVRAIVIAARGRVIKSIGDELMCCFASASDAVRAACEIQRRFEAAAGPPPRLSFRIGLHSGEAIWKDDDVFGDAVNTAARLAGMAKAGQIVTSLETLRSSPDLPRNSSRDIGALSVKGRRQPVQCVEVIWKDKKKLTARAGSAAAAAPVRLRLAFGPEWRMIEPDGSLLTTGRAPENDIVFDSPQVSSTHAVIEGRRDKYFLRDQSTNGCLVLVPGMPALTVHREEVVLLGSGTIFLGGAPTDPARALHFTPVS